MEEPKTTGERIALARRSYPEKMSQADLGARIGKSRDMVARYETDRDVPPVQVLAKIAEVLHVSLSWLLEGGKGGVESPLVHLTDQGTVSRTVDIPYWGEVPAGDWQAPAEGGVTVPVESSLARDTRRVVRVAGDSMYPRLHHGDEVLIELSKTPKEGVITLAANERGDFTLKVLKYTSASEWELRPINNSHAAPVSERWEVMGYAVSIKRHFGPGRYILEVDELGIRP